MISVFDYLDYRKFLSDSYLERKKENANFSHRFIANKLNFDSGYFAKIVKGERHISQRLIPKFIDLFKLNNKEASYFISLVLFCKAKTHDQKNRHFEDLMSFKMTDKNILTADQYALFENWYYLVIRETLAIYNFRGDYAELARLVTPKIKPSEAKKAISILEKLKLIKKNKDGLYERVTPIWSTGEEVKSVALVNLHGTMMDLAKEAYNQFSREEREMSTLTLSISEKEYQVMVKEMKILREKFLENARKCTAPDRVYQCNFSVFPVSKICQRDKGGS